MEQLVKLIAAEHRVLLFLVLNLTDQLFGSKIKALDKLIHIVVKLCVTVDHRLLEQIRA